MIDPQQIKRNILNDMRVELTEEFDRNFERKAFFTQKWKPRADKFANGSLLIVTGTLRRSIRSNIDTNGVRFTSAVPYASIHNEGGTGLLTIRAHNRRTPSGRITQVRAHQRKFNIIIAKTKRTNFRKRNVHFFAILSTPFSGSPFSPFPQIKESQGSVRMPINQHSSASLLSF